MYVEVFGSVMNYERLNDFQLKYWSSGVQLRIELEIVSGDKFY